MYDTDISTSFAAVSCRHGGCRAHARLSVFVANSQFGRPIDVMINNAGIGMPPGVEMQSEAWKKIVSINVRPPNRLGKPPRITPRLTSPVAHQLAYRRY
jgi:NAD(P)-dependent dehydrogenase (short-subunit alcohol dehydrogenase family)